MGGRWVHKMLSADAETRTGECANCGVVPVVRQDGRWKCSIARAEQRGQTGRWERTPTQRRQNKLKTKYGLTIEDVDAMVAAQGGRCPICGDELDTPCVDHDHGSGAVRGVLCRACNIGIGYLRDDPVILAAAIRYLSASG